MEPSKTVKALLFDLDGTLLNTLSDIADAMNAVLLQHRAPVHPVAAYKTFVGEGVSRLVARSLPERMRENSDLLLQCTEAFKTTYAACWSRKTIPYEGIVDLLASITAAALPMAILSNKSHAMTCATVDHFFSSFTFAAVIGDGNFPRKPDPAAAQYIASVVGVAPEHFLLIGDTKTDMQTAHAAGMVPVGVSWGFRDEAELRAHGASSILQHPSELLSLLQ